MVTPNESIEDPYVGLISDLDNVYVDQIVHLYSGSCQHADKINYDSNKLIINWSFILNTGGLVSILSFVSSSRVHMHLILSAMILFFMGIICIYFSVVLERRKFRKRGGSNRRRV